MTHQYKHNQRVSKYDSKPSGGVQEILERIKAEQLERMMQQRQNLGNMQLSDEEFRKDEE